MENIAPIQIEEPKREKRTAVTAAYRRGCIYDCGRKGRKGKYGRLGKAEKRRRLGKS